MTLRLFLLVVCAVLMLVNMLTGPGGAMSRVADMDRDRLASSIDDVGQQAFAGQNPDRRAGSAPGAAGPAEPGAGFDEDGDSYAEAEADDPDFGGDFSLPDDPGVRPVSPYLDSAPPVPDPDNFDPRIG